MLMFANLSQPHIENWSSFYALFVFQLQLLFPTEKNSSKYFVISFFVTGWE